MRLRANEMEDRKERYHVGRETVRVRWLWPATIDAMKYVVIG
jgi:hypothetical protein